VLADGPIGRTLQTLVGSVSGLRNRPERAASPTQAAWLLLTRSSHRDGDHDAAARNCFRTNPVTPARRYRALPHEGGITCSSPKRGDPRDDVQERPDAYAESLRPRAHQVPAGQVRSSAPAIGMSPKRSSVSGPPDRESTCQRGALAPWVTPVPMPKAWRCPDRVIGLNASCGEPPNHCSPTQRAVTPECRLSSNAARRATVRAG
jgi:hypothetical protein